MAMSWCGVFLGIVKMNSDLIIGPCRLGRETLIEITGRRHFFSSTQRRSGGVRVCLRRTLPNPVPQRPTAGFQPRQKGEGLRCYSSIGSPQHSQKLGYLHLK